MRKILLRLSHLLFRWYYKRVEEFFHDKTFFKSVKSLIKQYNSNKSLYYISMENCKFLMKENHDLRKELEDLKSKVVVNDKFIEWSNEYFGTNFEK